MSNEARDEVPNEERTAEERTAMNTAILNGRVIDPAAGLDRACGVYVTNGRIAAVGDVWGDMRRRGRSLEKPMDKLRKLSGC